MKKLKIGVNDQCPCWSGEKYKKCCRGIVDWPAVLASGKGHVKFLSARGRNILFYDAILEALQLDNEKVPDLAKYKRAFTADAVRKIHEAVLDLWPPDLDLKQVLKKDSRRVTGFYIGDYETEYLERSILRHCLYADKIILADPFLHPHAIAPKFNPIFAPDQHRAQTLKNVNRFFKLLPWIDAGLVVFTRTPEDLDRELGWQALQHAEGYKADPKIKKALDETVERLSDRHRDRRFKQTFLYAAPESYLRRKYREHQSESDAFTEDEFIEFIKKQRADDPDFLEPVDAPGKSQLHIMSAGGTVEMARVTAEMTGSYLFTDLHARWEMLKRDRETMAPVSKVWSPFAKAVQDADLSFLNNLDLSVALRLRSEGRLEGVRSVLRKAWKADLSSDEFDESNAIHLAENLRDSIRDSEAEWEDIRAELTKLGIAEVASHAVAAGPLIANGHAEWFAGAAIVTTAGHALYKHLRERGFEKRFPASFFLNLAEKN